MRNIHLLLAALLLPLLAAPFACDKSYSVAPLAASSGGLSGSAPTATSTPNTSFCAQLTTTPTPGYPAGIDWGTADFLLTDETPSYAPASIAVSAEVDLAVNGAPESTDTVFVTTPSGNVTLAYSGTTTTANGDVFAKYTYSSPGTAYYVAGGSYTITTVTSAGTASASLAAPGNIAVAADGLSTTWNGPALLGLVEVLTPGYSASYQNYGCGGYSSPFNIPSTAYASGSGTYNVVAAFLNATSAVNNGIGFVEIGALVEVPITK